ncbi:hypothetical protein GALMADRAFT_1209548 [Galerina marginata CBS 339.88]|uniref:Uncharacterized protein n=1 Tax=Galerina marginata (strain CBS 339.88) TaxID=685588 RepID=A0A067SH93_GALM3|nr:hypothetical protein GALMADRAFT_1209548 [Galerina marginata CBS 339.88]
MLYILFLSSIRLLTYLPLLTPTPIVSSVPSNQVAASSRLITHKSSDNSYRNTFFVPLILLYLSFIYLFRHTTTAPRQNVHRAPSRCLHVHSALARGVLGIRNPFPMSATLTVLPSTRSISINHRHASF